MRTREKSLRYILETKNGLKSDFIKDISEEEFESLLSTGMIIACQRVSGENSWKISERGYDYTSMIYIPPKYTFFERLHNSFNHWLMRHERRRERERQENKEKYFK